MRIGGCGENKSGANVEAFNNALKRNKVEIANLTNVVNNNTILNDFLKTTTSPSAALSPSRCSAAEA